MVEQTVREITTADIKPLSDYWMNASHDFLVGMGVDVSKMPSREQWEQMLHEQISQPYEEKKSYCIIWLANGEPVGHSNINKIIFGQEAYMHLHLWNTVSRHRGMGANFVKMTIPFFFNNYKLNTLYCEPYSLNPAPNKTLPKVGFDFVKEHVCVPGWIAFEQKVNLWQMSREKFSQLY